MITTHYITGSPAVHKHFVNSKRPVPNFLFLDQPSQAYYPAKYEETSGEYRQSNDDQMVEKKYDFVNMVVKELQPQFTGDYYRPCKIA